MKPLTLLALIVSIFALLLALIARTGTFTQLYESTGLSPNQQTLERKAVDNVIADIIKHPNNWKYSTGVYSGDELLNFNYKGDNTYMIVRKDEMHVHYGNEFNYTDQQASVIDSLITSAKNKEVEKLAK